MWFALYLAQPIINQYLLFEKSSIPSILHLTNLHNQWEVVYFLPERVPNTEYLRNVFHYILVEVSIWIIKTSI